ncbi:MAG: 50S ribosome-binding GTPase [Phycisphaerales bacterium]|nr:50S ribosome-binding GTPase [Phycisphaerales bacterium]
MQLGDTIIAVASPPGRSPRGLIRLSGPDSHALVANLPPRIGRIRLNLDTCELPALAIRFSAPASYTGEDVVELLLPGNPDLLERVIEHFVARGARRAGPGEFSARAFLNERITLAQAEGIAQAITARCDAQLAAAMQLMSGQLGRCCEAVAERIASLLALVEAGIDFTDQEDVIAVSRGEFLAQAQRIAEALDAHLSRAVGIEQLSGMPWVVLLGPTNAGKSSLFNALLGRERAVESATAGATRDVLVEPLRLPGGGEVMLVDLAGIGDDEFAVMKQAALARDDALARAELVIVCEPVTPTPEHAVRRTDQAIEGSLPPGATAIRVRTKCDRGDAGDACLLHVSAKTREGLDALVVEMERRLAGRGASLSADALALQPRHESALRRALERVAGAIELVRQDQNEQAMSQPELVAAELREALDALGELIGDVTPDEILGRVFASFCIGK